jgi:hypothetical protein
MAYRPPLKAKRDANEPQVFAILRAHGLMVYATDKPLDAIVGYGGRTYLVEVKDGPKARFRPSQLKFLPEWIGHAVVICTDDEALAFARDVRAGRIP